MLSILNVALSVVGGIVALIIPSLLVSQRRRLLNRLVEEAKALDVVKDDSIATANMRIALHATSKAYSDLAVLTTEDRARYQFRTYGIALGGFGLYFMIVYFAFKAIADEGAEDLARYGIYWPAVLMVSGALALKGRELLAVRAARNRRSIRGKKHPGPSGH